MGKAECIPTSCWDLATVIGRLSSSHNNFSMLHLVIGKHPKASRQELVEQDFRCRDGIQARHHSPLVPSAQDAGVGIPETMQALDVACLKNMRVIQTSKPFDGG